MGSESGEPVDTVRFRLLGPTEILVDGQPAALPGGAERALMVLLLLSPGRTIPATTLIDRLWSESSLPVDPMNALQIRVSKLRRALAAIGPDLVTRERVGYRINVAPSEIDAELFAQLLREARSRADTAAGEYSDDQLRAYDEALGLWAGDPLSDFPTEQWATTEAARLNELRLAALTERTQIALSLGRHVEAVGDLEPVVAQDPTQESLAGLLMTALYRSGRQADALEVYARTRSVLDDELGLEPSASLRSLHERVLRQDAALGGPSDSSVAPPIALTAPGRRRREPAQEATGTLPNVVRPLIGRDQQLTELGELLARERLVSLVGPGGAGKTTLALAAAVQAKPTYRDGAFGVRLAPVNDPQQVPVAVAEALGVPLDGAAVDRDVRGRLTRYLERRHLLLLLDNCEHVVDAVASLVDDMLGRCPELTVLTTSREALAVRDELQLLVGPLDTAPEGTPDSAVLGYPAETLFVERARMVRPGMALEADDRLAVARIARALDGLPLAIELAAARVSSMSPGEIADRLAHRFALLTTGARTAEARQQTLRATVDWSYDLLSPHEQVVFNRLAVFRGGWTLAAAEAVISDTDISPGAVLDTIGRLVERSLVVVVPGRTTRYRMLETLREFARERLADSAQDTELGRRHAEHFHRVTEEGDLALRGHGQREALRSLRAEQPNIRAALSFLGGPSGDPDQALSMAGSLGLFWHLGRHLEGRETLGRLLDLPDASPAARARALQAVSLVERPRACLVHPSPRCAETARESLAVFEELGDASRAALSRVLLAVEGVTGSDPEQSRALLAAAEDQFDRDGDAWGRAVIGFVRMETALKRGDEITAVPTGRATAAAFRELDDPWGLSAILYHLGWGLRQFGRYDDSARVLEEAIDVATGAGLYNTVQWALADLGVTLLHLDERAAARDAFDRAGAASEHVGDGAGTVLAGYGYALLAHTDGDWREARTHYADAVEGFAHLGTPVPQGLAVAGLARCDEAEGDVPSAGQRYEEVLETGRRMGEQSLTAMGLEGLARLAVDRGDDRTAHELAAEASRVRAASGRPAPPHERRDMDGLLPGPAGPQPADVE